MKQLTFKVPPSSSEQTITIQVPDSVPIPSSTVTVDYSGVQPVITGTTPITATPDPVETPPVVTPSPMDGYKLYWVDEFINANTINENIADHNQAARGGWSSEYGGSFKSVPDNVSAGTRSELQYEKSDTPPEGALAWSAVYKSIVPNNIHSAQFHPYTSGGSAAPGLWHIDGKFVLVNWKNGTNTRYPTNFTIPQDKQLDFVLQYKFGSAGYLRFFINGVKVLDKSGIQVGDGSGQYFKLGTNGWGSDAKNSLVYYLRIAVYQKV